MNMIILGIHLDQRRSEVCPGIGVNATMFDRYRLISLALTSQPTGAQCPDKIRFKPFGTGAVLV
ncbi:hypothetical protein ACTNAF_24220 [Escherichia coli]|uniref:hypothetical protein n=1 Tax=Escherichia coli TaxID=562 RepID=UPI003774875A